MKILITGSSGFLGKEIVKNLSSNNTIIELNRNKGHYQIDLSTSEPKFDSNFDLIIHSAGKAHSIPKTEEEKQMFFNVNVQGTKNLLIGLEKNGIPQRFIYISSVSVYGLEQGELVDEEYPLNAKDTFGQNKIQAERLIQDWCEKNNVIYTILRLPLLVGMNPPGNLAKMINGIKNGRYFNIAGGKARKSMVLTTDVAKVLIEASNKGGIYNLTDGYHPNFYELSNHIAKQINKKRIYNIPSWLAQSLAFIGNVFGNSSPINSKKLQKLNNTLTFNDSKARKAFGWNPEKVLKNFKITN